MEYNFPKIELSAEEQQWLGAICHQFMRGCLVDVNSLKKSWYEQGKWPEGFKPSEIDSRLLQNGNEPTLLGIWHAYPVPNNLWIEKFDQLIKYVKKRILNSTSTEIKVTEIATAVGITERSVSVLIHLLKSMGFSYTATVASNRHMPGEIEMYTNLRLDDPEKMGDYLSYKNIEEQIKKMFGEIEASDDLYLNRLKKVYQATGGSRRKAVNLADVLRDEGLSQTEIENVAEYMEGEGWIKAMSDEGIDYYITHPGIKAAQAYNPSISVHPLEPRDMSTPQDKRNVFVVHGRNLEARNSLFRFLRSIELKPLEWSQAIKATGKASPFTGEILDVAFSNAQAVVVLLTPDDEAQLREPFRNANDPPYESQLTGQARPNVLFEAGMAMGRNPDRTIIVELGIVRPFSDIAGRHTVRLTNNIAARQELAQRLETAGCPVDLTGRDWHTEGDFNEDGGKALANTFPMPAGEAADTTVNKTANPAASLISTDVYQHSNTPQIATQWLREFLSPIVDLLDETKKKFNQNAFALERSSVEPDSTAYLYRIDFFRRERWDELLTSDVGEYFLMNFPQIGEVLVSFGKSMDEFERAVSNLDKSIEGSPHLLKQLKDTYARLIERERIPRSEYENSNLKEIVQRVFGQLHWEMSKHPAECKDNLVHFTAYSLLGLNINFKPNALTEDQQLFYFCRDISSELRGKDESVSRSLEETQQLFDAIKDESSTLHQRLKREKIEIARRYNATF